MYGYRVKLYSHQTPITTINKSNFIELLPPWNSRYFQLVGFVKDLHPISIYQLQELEDLNKIKGYYPVFIQLNGVPKTLKSKIKSIERVTL